MSFIPNTISGKDSSMFDETDMHELIGKTIERVEVSERESYMRITTDDGVFTYEAWGDCCSETWFAEIIGFDALIGKTVTAVEQLDLPEKDDGHTRQDYDQFYGIGITTMGGRCQIVYRNSSNGYYGGNLQRATFSERYPEPKWRVITDDWTAY